MKIEELQSCLLLLLTSVIWGFAFVTQQIGSAYVPAFEFNCVKFGLGTLTLIPVILFSQKKTCGKIFQKNKLQRYIHYILPRGAVMGVVLYIAASLQQLGIALGSTAGKSGFITGFYTVLVPLIAMFIGRKSRVTAWISAVLAAVGIFLISVKENLTMSFCDILELASSIFWAIQILFTDRYSKEANCLGLAFSQFAVCAVLSLCTSQLCEKTTVNGLFEAAAPILYGGIFSVGVAFTLQIVGQRKARPAQSAVIMSMESFFAAVGGFLILGEKFTFKGYIGCVLMIMAIILSQIPSFCIPAVKRYKTR